MTQGTVKDMKEKSSQLTSEVSKISISHSSNIDEPDSQAREQSSHEKDLERIICDIDSETLKSVVIETIRKLGH